MALTTFTGTLLEKIPRSPDTVTGDFLVCRPELAPALLDALAPHAP